MYGSNKYADMAELADALDSGTYEHWRGRACKCPGYPPLVEENSRLGYTEELDYACAKEQLLWKIQTLKTTLEEEIKLLLENKESQVAR